jgi:hypothetical protein
MRVLELIQELLRLHSAYGNVPLIDKDGNEITIRKVELITSHRPASYDLGGVMVALNTRAKHPEKSQIYREWEARERAKRQFSELPKRANSNKSDDSS